MWWFVSASVVAVKVLIILFSCVHITILTLMFVKYRIILLRRQQSLKKAANSSNESTITSTSSGDFNTTWLFVPAIVKTKTKTRIRWVKHSRNTKHELRLAGSQTTSCSEQQLGTCGDEASAATSQFSARHVIGAVSHKPHTALLACKRIDGKKSEGSGAHTKVNKCQRRCMVITVMEQSEERSAYLAVFAKHLIYV